MYSVCMDSTRGICVFLIILVQQVHVQCEDSNTTFAVPDVTVIQARCLARCYNLFGVEQTPKKINDNEQLPVRECKSAECKQCSLPCNISSVSADKCGRDLCGVHQRDDRLVSTDNRKSPGYIVTRRSSFSDEKDDSCHASCAFLTDVYQQSKPTNDKNRLGVLTSIGRPDIVCKNVPYGKNKCNNESIATIYIRWSFNSDLVGTTPIFVISMRYIVEEDKQSNWTVTKLVTGTFVEISDLRCSTPYQFCVTAVLADGSFAQSAPTSWSRTPGFNYIPAAPKSLTVSEALIVNQRPAVNVTWDPGAEAPCFYMLFWFDRTDYQQVEIRAPKQFRYQINKLNFSKNYTIRLFSIDDAFEHTSKEKLAYVMTPDCLLSTGYNHTVCAPEKPRNLTLQVLTPDHKNMNVKFINVKLSWQPPVNTRNGSDIIRYILLYRKEPPYDVVNRIEPHNAKIIVNDSSTSTVLKLHNHNLYSFELTAVTNGGKGEREYMTVYIDEGLKNNTIHGLVTPVDIFTEEPDVTPQTENSSSNSLTALELVSIVLVPVVLFVVLVFIVAFVIVRRRRNYKKYPSPGRFGPVEELNPIYDGMALNIDSDKKALLAMDGYEIDYSCLDFISVIGEGAFGKVVKAEYYPSTTDRRNQQGKIVAVKMLRDFYTGDESRNFLLEIQAMKNLGHHPYIVSIIGCCLTGPKLCLIMDYCALGDLRNYLRKYREKLMYSMSTPYGLMSKASNCYMQDQMYIETQNSNSSGNQDAEEATYISEAQLLSYARQITMGMEFLEQRKFVHRDLAARNILLFDHRHIKISDFGLTRDVYETNVYQPTSARKLPYKWMAIESLFSQRFTVKSDIWSFGIVLWEIVTLGGSPYPSIPLKDLYGLLNDGYRMEKPENCSTNIYQIMLSCWHPNPHSRPTFNQLKQELEKLLEETMSYIDLSVEVSEDYFNESTNDSNAVGYQTSASRDTVSEVGSERSHEIFEDRKLFVDIHKNPKSIDSPQNSSRKTLTLDDEADYLEGTVSSACDSNDDRVSNFHELQPEYKNFPKTVTQFEDLKGTPCHLVKSVFQDSLQYLLENVKNEPTVSRPSTKKICVSMENVSGGHMIQSTSL